MKISFHGAAQTVTGSKHLITLNDGTNILLDCGMFQGMGARTQQLNENFGFDASTVSVVLLSHAHIDHSGLIPKLVAEGFTGKIYCTQATKELTEILLYDSATIQSHALEEKHATPCYLPDDVAKSMAMFEIIGFDEWTEVLPAISVLYTQTGHLIGGAAIHLKIMENGRQTIISFSADVGRARHQLLKPATPFPQADYIILESTYGDKRHNLLLNNIDILLKHIQQTCVQKQGKLIIPAFSVGRTQEILFMLNQLELEKRLPPLKYFVDSPLSMKATETIKQHVDEFNDRLQDILKVDDDPFAFEGLKYVESTEDSIRLTEYRDPCVIISSSGTADAGRVRHHIRHALGDAKNTILFSGYCGPESLGGQLLKGSRTIEIFDTVQEVRATVGKLDGLSAHGDVDDLCQFVACQDPGYVRAVFLVHGEHKAQEALAGRLATKGFYPVHIPAMHESFELGLAFKQGMTG
ncbi:MAG: MBL fold metallo-hydrolase [Bacteroidetes bacterium]|nr:MBL fold metallo-hydrolase [Bacteroidota bacterium]